MSGVKYKIIEHETGPEILVLIAAGVGLVTKVVELVTAIIKARSEGIKRGDHHRDPLELIVRGYKEDGKFFQETVLRISPESDMTPKQIETALKKGIAAKKSKSKSKTK